MTELEADVPVLILLLESVTLASPTASLASEDKVPDYMVFDVNGLFYCFIWFFYWTFHSRSFIYLDSMVFYPFQFFPLDINGEVLIREVVEDVRQLTSLAGLSIDELIERER